LITKLISVFRRKKVEGNHMENTKFIDLRSDTVTLPTEEMLEAIKYAKLGDDVFAEDPTVNQLQEMASEKMGKEAALLVPSGTQANLISLMSNCKRGDMVILESECHIYWYEVGGVSAVAGLLPWLSKSSAGAFDVPQLEALVRHKSQFFPDPSLVCVENTHNRHGGTIITPNQLEKISEIAKKHSIKLYMDGARIFNAAIGLGLDVEDFTKHVDNLMFSLSKGLCCPVGSIIVGNQEFIDRAKKNRKMLGGGMRQAGIIAAPGIVALEKMIDRLKEDHENAKFIAERMSKFNGIRINLEKVQTNIVSFDLDEQITDDIFLRKLREKGVLALAQAKNKIRLVTHFGINRDHAETAVEVIKSVLAESAG
jgi:threonine aldolase